MQSLRTSLLSWIVFVPTASLILALLISVIFPALILGTTNNIRLPDEINVFELGVFAIPLLAINGIVFFCIILHYTKRLPERISNPLRFIFEFEVSKKITIIALCAMIGGYGALSVNEIWQEDPWEDYERTVKPALENWSIDKPFTIKTIVYFFGSSSMQIFGTYRVIPFFASIAMLVLTYLITTEMTKKRFSGLVSASLLIQSSNFLIYDTTITYPNFWGAFYLLSLYLMFKKWPVSIISFTGSLLTKTLAIGLFPFSLAFAALSEIPRKRKIAITASYMIILVVGILLLARIDIGIIDPEEFNASHFFSSLTILATQFRYDVITVWFLLPVVFGLFIKAKNGFANANAVMVLIFGTLLLAVLIPALSTYTNSPYRFVPFSAFFAISVGTILAKR